MGFYFFSIFGIDMPSPAETMASTGEWSTAMFSELWPMAAIVSGFIIAGLLGWFIPHIFVAMVSKIIHKKDKF